MEIKLLDGYPDLIGKRFAFAAFGNGPKSFSLANGDTVNFPSYDNYIDSISPATSLSGNYDVKFTPSVPGHRAKWSAFWYSSGKQGVSSVAQNAAGTGMTPGTYTINATAGGAQIQITVLTATTIGPIKVLKSGAGYTAAPTFTLTPLGGTPPTLTIVVAPAAGIVPDTTDLSGETVQFGGYGGRY